MKSSLSADRFESLLDEHRKILFKVCNSYCRQADDRDDLAQEIVLQLWRSFGRYDESLRFSTWMYRIALNVAISRVRKDRPATQELTEEILVSRDDEPSEEMRLLREFIEGLDVLNKALMLLYLDGYTHAEIGEVLGITGANAGMKISRLKQTMREEFKEKEDGPR